MLLILEAIGICSDLWNLLLLWKQVQKNEKLALHKPKPLKDGCIVSQGVRHYVYPYEVRVPLSKKPESFEEVSPATNWLIVWLLDDAFLVALGLVALSWGRRNLLHDVVCSTELREKGVETGALHSLGGVSELVVGRENCHKVSINVVKGIFPGGDVHFAPELYGYRVFPITLAINFKKLEHKVHNFIIWKILVNFCNHHSTWYSSKITKHGRINSSPFCPKFDYP